MTVNHRLFGILVLSGSVATGEAPSWSHDPAAANGPMHWGGVAAQFATCGQKPAGSASFVEVGMKQTPINIEKGKAVATALPAIDFAYKSMPLEVENTGHVVEVVYQPGSSIRLGKSAIDTYDLAQFHFHAP